MRFGVMAAAPTQHQQEFVKSGASPFLLADSGYLIPFCSQYCHTF